MRDNPGARLAAHLRRLSTARSRPTMCCRSGPAMRCVSSVSPNISAFRFRHCSRRWWSERLLDLLSLLIAFGVVLLVLPVAGGAAGTLVGIGGSGLIAIGLAVMAVLLFPQMFEPIARFFLGILSKMSPGVGGKLTVFVDGIFVDIAPPRARASHADPRLVVGLRLGIGGHSLLGRRQRHPRDGRAEREVGCPFRSERWQTLLPSTPGYVGTFDFFAIKAAQAMGNSAAAAAASRCWSISSSGCPPPSSAALALMAWNAAKPSSLTQNTERAAS